MLTLTNRILFEWQVTKLESGIAQMMTLNTLLVEVGKEELLSKWLMMSEFVRERCVESVPFESANILAADHSEHELSAPFTLVIPIPVDNFRHYQI